MDSNPLKYIFVSHSSQDWNKVRLIRNFLEEQSFYPLLFHLKCLETGGEDLVLLKDLIHREILARRRFLYCNSENAVKSEYVQWEIDQVNDVKGAIFKEVNIEKSSNEIQEELLGWTTFLKTIGFIGTWRSRTIRRKIIEKLQEIDSNLKVIAFEDDEHIPVWNGALPQGALDYINQQISKLDQASLIIAFKTSDFYARGFCSRAEYHIEQRNGMRLLSLDIPDSQSNEPDEIFVNQLVDTVIANYFI